MRQSAKITWKRPARGLLALLLLTTMSCSSMNLKRGEGSHRGASTVSTELRFTLPDLSPLLIEDKNVTRDINAYALLALPLKKDCGKTANPSGPYSLGTVSVMVDASCDYQVSLALGNLTAYATNSLTLATRTALIDSGNASVGGLSSPNTSLTFVYYQMNAPVTVYSSELMKYKAYSTALTLTVTEAGKSLGIKTKNLKTVVASQETGTDPGTAGADPTTGTNAGLVTYNKDIRPIMESACLFCHNGNRASDLSSYSQVKSEADKIYGEVVISKTMPQTGTLSQSERNLFESWKNGGYLEKADDSRSGSPSADANLVEFHIKAGTGSGAWNDAATIVKVRVGQTLRIYNDDAISHQLHTNGAPCAHGDPMAPGKYFDCVVRQPYSGQPLYDHNYEGSGYFYVEASR